jgi:hypothetical protein
MALAVIGAGFGRTGTLSLREALDRLGFGPCYHMIELIEHPEHVDFWERAAAGGEVDWDEVLRGYRAAVDWPACNFYAPLAARYADAKVILTVRDPERWHESDRQTISPGSSTPQLQSATTPPAALLSATEYRDSTRTRRRREPSRCVCGRAPIPPSNPRRIRDTTHLEPRPLLLYVPGRRTVQPSHTTPRQGSSSCRDSR